ncbi:MAG: NUDIX domain-containing protein [Treponema sp.]|jgi:mutator protein MutT|nr:NUDIX domain-containing protein [Treponema sp.]
MRETRQSAGPKADRIMNSPGKDRGGSAAPFSVAGIALWEDRFFIARRLPGGSLGGKWEFPGGKAEEGEGAEDALIREFQEEFSLPIRVGEELGKSLFLHNGVERSLRAYRIYLDPGDPAHPPVLSDHAEWKWATLAEIEGLDFAPSDLGLLPALKAYLKTNP